MISDKDIIRVHFSLEVPVMIAEMLDRRMPLPEDESYALEVALSEMTAEKCLLTAACAARYMAMEKFLDEALQIGLSIQADAAFDDYAPRYLAGLHHSMKQTCSGYAIYMQEDLESFADLFSMAASLPDVSVALHDIAIIFYDHCSAHAAAMDVEHDLFDYDEAGEQPVRELEASSFSFSSAVPVDNVIAFPALNRRPV